jgi:hypothetical protein
LHIEIIAGLSLTNRRLGLRGKDYRLRWFLEVLDPLAALAPANGSLRLTGVDLDRGRIAFDADFTHSSGWDKVHDDLDALAPEVVEFESLAEQKHTNDFFKQFIQERLNAEIPVPDDAAAPDVSTAPAAATSARDPLRVLIILGAPVDRGWRRKVTPVVVPANCRCRVYYLYSWWLGWGGYNDLGRVLKPLKPKVFRFYAAPDYRRALAKLVKELRQL